MLEISTFHSSVELDVAGGLLSSGIAQDFIGGEGGGYFKSYFERYNILMLSQFVLI